MKKLLVGLSGHGYGHLGQTAPILNRLTGFELVVATTLSDEALRRQLTVPFTRIQRSLDVGVRNRDALTVDQEATRRAYQDFHRSYGLEEEIAWLRSLKPDLILANVPYRIAEAAARLEIPCVAMCSLNWADIVPELPQAARIRQAYARLTEFWLPTPSMPMHDMPARRRIGLVSRQGRPNMLKGKNVLVSLGGLDFPPPRSWPAPRGVTFLVPEGWLPDHPRAVAADSLGVPFIDLMASVDLLITKPGYGSYAEAAAHGLPVLSLRRPDWPEEPFLWNFLHQRGGLRELTTEAFLQGDIPLEPMLQAPRPDPIEPIGVQQAVELLQKYRS